MKKILLSLCCLFVLGGCSIFPIEQKVQEETPSEIIEEPKEEETEAPEQPVEVPKSRAEAILENMTLEEKVSQMFLVRYSDQAAQDLALYDFGGFIFFARDFADETIVSMNEKITALQHQNPINMFMGVDEEGGIVNRISLYPQYRAVPFHSPQSLYQEGGIDLVSSDTLEKCNLLRSIGLNMNFAPVVDVPETAEDYIYERSFGTDPELTAQYAQTVVSVMKEEKIASVLKHFPGYGNNEDTHTGVAIDERSLESFYERDFIPFSAGIEAGADLVLITHTIVKNMDEFTPASLSSAVHEILRNDLGFEGVIVTDDLFMQGVRDLYSDEEAAIQAVISGNDLICTTNYEVQIPAVIQAVKDGKINEERIDESVLRILNCKLKLGIIS